MFLCYTVPPGHLRLHLRSQEGDITYLVITGCEYVCFYVILPPRHLRLHLRSQEGDITYLIIIGREYVCFYVILFLLDISGFIYDPRKET